MRFRFGLVALGLCLLLTPISAGAQLQITPHQGAMACRQETAMVPNIVTLTLYVVRNGRLQQLNLTADQLTHAAGGITVEGYVHGAVALSSDPMTALVDREPMNVIRTGDDGRFRIKGFGAMAPCRFWGDHLPAPYQEMPAGQFQGRYARFARVPLDSLSKAPAFEVVFNGKPITIHQNSPLRLAPGQAPAVEIDYLGRDPQRLAGTPAGFNARLEAIQAGVRAVGALCGDRVVDQVRIIECDGRRNAYSLKNRTEIWLYSGFFRHESLPELRTVIEHEALHILTDRLGLQDNPRVRALFADLTAAVPASGTSLLFDFINETNFIRGMSGGHARESIDEFCASFLHTLLYVDRLELLLDQPVITQKGALIPLSAAAREQLLTGYHLALETIGNEIMASAPETPLTALFLAGLAATHRLGIPFETRCAEMAGTSSRQPS